MDKRLVFDEDVINYDKWRPRYCADLFSDIVRYSGIDSNKLAVEVGPGTGQATEPILKTGCSYIAVEIGKNFCEYIRRKYKDYPKFHTINKEFEKCHIDENSVDLLFSATAFHWIPEKEGFAKAHDMLKSGAALALFWNRPFVGKQDDLLHHDIDSIYKRFRLQDQDKQIIEIEYDKKRYQSMSGAIKNYGFIHFEYTIYKQTRCFNPNDYVSLLNTYSDHRQLKDQQKWQFESEIKAAIVKHGGVITVYDTMDLYLAQKP